MRAVNGQPDLEVRPMQGTLGEDLFAQVATHPDVARANLVLEATAMARPGGTSARQCPHRLRLLGADALLLPAMAPALMPQAMGGAARCPLLPLATVCPQPRRAAGAGRAARRAPSPALRCNCRPACKPGRAGRGTVSAPAHRWR